MGIMKSLTKTLTSWYNEKEAQEKEERVEALDVKATKVVNNTEHLIQSYRRAARIYSNGR